MINKLKRINIYYIIIFLFWFFHAIYNYIWLSENQVPPYWDESRYLLMGLKYEDLFSQISSFNFRSFAEIGGYYPFLFPTSSLILTSLWGNSIRTMVMTNTIYMAIMLFSIFKIGEIIFNRKAGLWAAFTLSMFPIVFGTSRMFLLDYSLSAMVTLSIYLLLLTDYFKNTKNSVLFGVSLGLGMLTKNTFPGFIIGPLFYIFYSSMIKSSKEGRHKQIANLFYSLSTGIILALPWYLLSFPFAQEKITRLSKRFLISFWYSYPYLLGIIFLFLIFIAIKIYKPYLFSQRYLKIMILIFCFLLGLFYLLNKIIVINFLWYFLGIRNQVGSFFFILFIFGCYHFLFRRLQNTHVLLLGIWIVIPCFSGFFFGKDFRYTMPFLPAVALIIAGGIQMLNSKQRRERLVSSILIFSLLQFSFFMYPITARHERSKTIEAISTTLLVLGISPSWLFHPPRKGDAKITEILKWIDRDAKKKKVTVGLIVDYNIINHETLTYYTYVNKIPIEIKGYVSGHSLWNMDLECFKSDYIITLSDPRTFRWKWDKEIILKLHQLLKENSKFVLVKEFKMPFYMSNSGEGDENVLYIYKRLNGRDVKID